MCRGGRCRLWQHGCRARGGGHGGGYGCGRGHGGRRCNLPQAAAGGAVRAADGADGGVGRHGPGDGHAVERTVGEHDRHGAAAAKREGGAEQQVLDDGELVQHLGRVHLHQAAVDLGC